MNRVLFSQLDVCPQVLMACILLTDMDPPTTTTATTPTTTPSDPACSKKEPSAACLSVHLFHRVRDEAGGGCRGSEGVLSFPPGRFVAEELCVSAAQACGEFQEEPSGSSNPTSRCSIGLFGTFCWDAGPSTSTPG